MIGARDWQWILDNLQGSITVTGKDALEIYLAEAFDRFLVGRK